MTWQLSGVVTDIRNPAALDGSVAVGSPIGGVLTFDTGQPDLNPAPEIGGYLLRAAPAEFRLSVGGYSVTATVGAGGAPNFSVGVFNEATLGGFPIGAGHDEIWIQSGSATGSGEWEQQVLLFAVVLMSDTNPLSSTAIPPTLDPSQWSHNVVGITNNGSPQFEIRGTVTYVVPEPPTGVGLGSSLAFLAVSRALRRATRSG